MRRYSLFLSANCVFFVLLIILAGCRSSPPTKFYALTALSDETPTQQVPVAGGHLSVGIDPVQIPDYLDRLQIVTRSGLNELKRAEYDRWAGSLGENITAVIAENLSLLLSTDNVFPYPWNSSTPVDFRARINIVRLESIAGDHVELKAIWTVSYGRENKEVLTKASVFREPWSGRGYEAMAAAMSRVLESLCREIGAEIRKIND
jgi:uncharacterized lipoprotein YmbA